MTNNPPRQKSEFTFIKPSLTPVILHRPGSFFWKKINLGLALLGIVAGYVPAAPAPELNATPPSEISAALQPFVDNHIIAGCVALVATKDKMLCLETVGYADIETKKPMKADTLFAIASMTKAHSCAAYMTLVDEGKMKVDDPVEKYIPEFKKLQMGDPDNPANLHAPSHPITLKECMTHTAGLPPKIGQRKDFRPSFVSLKADAAAMAGKVPLNVEPGTKYQYSVGIDLVGAVVEVITGMRYADFMQKRLFDPLELKDATFFPTQDQVNRLARTVKVTPDKQSIQNVNVNQGHQHNPAVPDGLLCQQTMDIVARYQNHCGGPSGGLFSTAEDVMKFCQMLLNDGEYHGKRILSPEAVKMMTTNEIKGIGNYGFGLVTMENDPQFSPGSYNHRGARSTMMWVDKQRGLVLVLLLQASDDLGQKEKELYHAFTTAAFAKYGSH